MNSDSATQGGRESTGTRDLKLIVMGAAAALSIVSLLMYGGVL